MALPRLVVVGRVTSTGAPAISTSDDAVLWTPQIAPTTPFSVQIGAVTFGDDRFIAANARGGSTFNTLRSTDGVAWTLYTAGPSKALAAFGNGVWVSISATGSYTSTDGGVTWTTHSSVLPNSAWTRLVFGNGMFVAVGTTVGASRTIAYSTDGITWGTVATTVNWADVMFGNGLFVATRSLASSLPGTVQPDGTLTSPDGINWTVRSSFRAGWSKSCYGNGVFLVVGSGFAGVGFPVRMTSTDGITWTYGTVGAATGASLTFVDGQFVMVDGGTGNILTSATGTSWSTTTIANRAWLGIAAGPPTTPVTAVGWVRGHAWG